MKKNFTPAYVHEIHEWNMLLGWCSICISQLLAKVQSKCHFYQFSFKFKNNGIWKELFVLSNKFNIDKQFLMEPYNTSINFHYYLISLITNGELYSGFLTLLFQEIIHMYYWYAGVGIQALLKNSFLSFNTVWKFNLLNRY